MKGEFGNRDDGIAVRAALKGLNWHDQMEKARSMREERLRQEPAQNDPSAPENLQPIFRRLKRTRDNTLAEEDAYANWPGRQTKSCPKPATEGHRGIRLESAMAGNDAVQGSASNEETLGENSAGPPFGAIEEQNSGSEEQLDAETSDPGIERALVLVSPVMDGEVLDVEPEPERKRIVVRPATDKRTGWRLAVGFGFGLGLGIGLSVLVGVALLGSLLDVNRTETTLTNEDVSQAGTAGPSPGSDGQASIVKAAPLDQAETQASNDAPLLITSSPSPLAPAGQGWNTGVASGQLTTTHSDTVQVSLGGRLLPEPPAPGTQPSLLVAAPRPRDNASDMRAQSDPGLAGPPANARLPGADRLTAMLNAPLKLSEEKVQSAATSLRQTGLEIRAVNRVNFKVGSDHIRYYHIEDAAMASSIADHIGALARDFTSFRPLPPSGSIEIYLAGNGRPTVPRKVAAADPVSALQNLRNSIVRTLRR